MCPSDPAKCTTKGIVYRLDCLNCLDEDEVTKYLGESAHTGFERGLEHQALIDKMDPKSPVIENRLEAHQYKPVRITMKLVSKEQRPLDRKILESCLIAEIKEGQLMNRRGELGQNLPQKIEIIGVEDSEYGLKKKRIREVTDEAT